ncbi:MAG: RHS repeat-associated core domain-containing protein [Saprospiraceae bacterium]|nr:RHS repeat-associated core domain-containing protein [Saprospiraceae bacterium]
MVIREIEVHSESMAEQKLGGYSSRYRFTGKELYPLSGLYDFGARYYDPRLSVWFGVDPLAEKYPGWSPYNYTLNNPIRMIDPDGRP